MQISSILGLAALATSATAITGTVPCTTATPSPDHISNTSTTVSYDTGYDDGSRSLTSVACSDGEHGLISRYKWQTQGQIPRFPHIGGAQAVNGWNSPSCGTCWSLKYQGRSVNILAIDRSINGFNIGLHAMNELTGGRGVEAGRVEAEVTQVDVKECGL